MSHFKKERDTPELAFHYAELLWQIGDKAFKIDDFSTGIDMEEWEEKGLQPR